MNCKIEFDDTAEVINITYVGEVSLEERVQAVKEVAQKYEKFMPLKIIIDVRDLEMHLSLDDQKYFGQYLASHESLQGAKVAVLHPSKNNPNLVIDVHAFTNGYRLAEFKKLQDAKSWLLEA